mmetsp:Transcript_39600/g.122221  ORF Transcript_39600/g.122221 Transcript_39600/m.122221 type:complete len:274 (-) Transcript_39600:333-1154(-)
MWVAGHQAPYHPSLASAPHTRQAQYTPWAGSGSVRKCRLSPRNGGRVMRQFGEGQPRRQSAAQPAWLRRPPHAQRPQGSRAAASCFPAGPSSPSRHADRSRGEPPGPKGGGAPRATWSACAPAQASWACQNSGGCPPSAGAASAVLLAGAGPRQHHPRLQRSRKPAPQHALPHHRSSPLHCCGHLPRCLARRLPCLPSLAHLPEGGGLPRRRWSSSAQRLQKHRQERHPAQLQGTRGCQNPWLHRHRPQAPRRLREERASGLRRADRSQSRAS